MARAPSLPGAPGVPAPPPTPLMTADTASSSSQSGAPQWGIFLKGKAVIASDNVLDFEYKRDWNVADFPLEKGAFESYDKVQNPFDVRFRFSCGGSKTRRTAFLNSIDTACESMDLYDVVTPEKTWISVNLDHADFARKQESGQGLITADVWGVEVRVTATQTFTQTKSPSGQKPVSGGQVQTKAPTPPQRKSWSDILPVQYEGR